MVNVLLRIAVWVVVLGIAYYVIGPERLGSSRGVDPDSGDSKIYLPPIKSQRYVEYDEISKVRSLNPEELAEYRALVQERESSFWQQDGVSVQEALSGVERRRKERLAAILQQRGVTKEELAIFLFVVERDHPGLLTDRE